MTPNYYIDFDWYRENGRSFSALAQSRLCLSCRDKIDVSESSDEELLLAIKDCCSQNPNFNTSKMSILETVFRIFLANGNQPLTLDEIFHQLEEYQGENFGLATEALRRLLDNERYYGLRKIPEEPVESEEPEELEAQEPVAEEELKESEEAEETET